MGWLSLVSQLVALAVSAWAGWSGHLSLGVSLAVSTWAGHHLFMWLSDRLMRMTQRWMTSEDLLTIALTQPEKVPTSWKLIGHGCGLAFSLLTLWGSYLVWQRVAGQ